LGDRDESLRIPWEYRRVLVVAVMEYVYLVPQVEEPDHLFLKTVIPSRKATRDYGRRGEK
jgi:hypothetical protein